MDKIIRDKWIAALRSGQYKQNRGVLRHIKADGPTYCCLGVLCMVEGKTIVQNNDDLYLWFSEILGVYRDKLIDKNDIYRENFNQIATYIEENL